MRAALVSEHASPLAALGGVDAGGQNVHVAALSAALARRGTEVVVHTRRDDPKLPRRVELCSGVDVDHIDAGPPRYVPKDELLPHMDQFAEELVRAWERDRPDVVHSHFWMSGYAALKAARELGIPIAHTYHALGVVKRRYQGDRDTSPPERQGIEREILMGVDRVVATCTDEAFELVRLGAERAQLTVIPCGVDVSRFVPDGPAEPRTPGMHRIACVGRMVERKGIGNVITALASVPDTELVIVGGPEQERLQEDAEYRRLRALAEQEGVADRVRFRGRVERHELPALLRSCDAVVCVPWYEPFGIVPLEAMACGVPVVASAVGGLIDSVVDESTGIHVPPRDPERLADDLRALLADPARRAAMGEAGALRARRLYDWERVGAATLDVYESLVASRRRASRRFRRASDAKSYVAALSQAVAANEEVLERAEEWGRRLATRLLAGGRLLALGNGGSAAEAQHLTAELVGRFEDERRPLSAICLHGDTSSLTAIANDYGAEAAFARQVEAHARTGDVLLALSTSGRSQNVVAAVRTARELGVTTWALTGPEPNPLLDLCDDSLCFAAPRSSTVQELHLVAIHILCCAVDAAVAERSRPRGRRAVTPARAELVRR